MLTLSSVQRWARARSYQLLFCIRNQTPRNPSRVRVLSGFQFMILANFMDRVSAISGDSSTPQEPALVTTFNRAIDVIESVVDAG